MDDAGNIPGATFTSPLCSCAGGPSNCAVWQHVFMTNYGFIDNSPPSAIIAYPNSGPKGHSQATEGTGTYDDPITCASDTSFSQGGATLSPGTIVYNPISQKYYIVEDGCTECSQDYNCKYDDDDDAGPGNPPAGCKKDTYLHIDFWMGPSMDLGTTLDNELLNCEGLATLGDAYNESYAVDGGPGYGVTDGTVIVNPPSNLPVRTGQLFTASGTCWTPTQVLPIQMVCH
jgi:hypothetical protein